MIKKFQKLILLIYYKLGDIINSYLKDIKLCSVEDAYSILRNAHPDAKSSCIKPDAIFKNANTHKLSIIVPSYNNAHFLKRCIDSVITQKSDYDYELIIVNDGSKDNTRELLSAYEENPQIKVIHQENKGLSGARNTGIEHAEGLYLSFLDADDNLLPGSINALMGTAMKYDADIVEGNYILTYENNRGPIKNSSYKFRKTMPLGQMKGFMWGKVYKRELFRKVRFNEGYWFEDSLNANILFCMTDKCYIIPDYVYAYLQNDKGITRSSNRSVKSIDSLYINFQLIKDHEALGLEFNQKYYEYFMHVVEINFMRTRFLEYNLRKAVFKIECHIRTSYFNGFRTGKKKYMDLEKALINEDFRLYIFNQNMNRNVTL